MSTGIIRYVYLAAGTIVMLFLGLINAWSIFRAPFNEVFASWTISELSLPFTISMTFFCLGGFIGGKLAKVLKSNFILLIAAVFLFFCFFFLSHLNPLNPQQSLVRLYMFYGIFGGLGAGIAYNAVLGAIIKWFPDRVGFASGILLMGAGVGGLTFGGLANVLIVNFGIFQAFFVLAFVVLFVLLFGSFFLRPVPIAFSGGNTASNIKGNDYTSSQMVKTPVFWLFLTRSFLVSSVGMIVINNAAVIAAVFGAAAVLGLMVSASSGFGRIAFGGLMDKLGRRKTLNLGSFILLLSGINLYAGAIWQNVYFIFIGLLLAGLTTGANLTISSVFTNKFFGPKNYPVNFSVHNFVLIPAAIMGPMVSSFMLERANGAYHSTFIMIIVLALLSFVINILLNRLIPKPG